MKCPNCNEDTNIVYQNPNMPYGISLKDKTINIEVSYCKTCNFIFQSSAYNKESTYDENIAKLYSSYNISSMYNFPNRSLTNVKALDFIKEFIKDDIEFNVLEIGSNRGDFLFLLKEEFPKINVIGCEPTEFKELKVPTLNSFFDKNLFNTKFDLIILRHTLEHIKYPKSFLKEIACLLKLNSKVFIEVPNIIYSLTKFVEDFTPDHVNFFSKQTLISSFENKKILKIDETEYLYAMFENDKEEKNSMNKQHDIFHMFEIFNQKIEDIKIEITKYDRIIFYGVSNFYLWAFGKLKNSLKNKELFFMDDFLEKDHINNLKKVTTLKNTDLIILCTSNKNLQKQMYDKLPQESNVLFPWEGIKNV